MQTSEQKAYVELIKACGYRVFHPEKFTTYVYYTDGTRIGYAQWGRFENSVNTVHKANVTTGTGFKIADEINKETLAAGLTMYPGWADRQDRDSVRKYKDWDSFASQYWQKLIEA